MSIYSFDEIPNLRAYFNAAEAGSITKSDSIVSSVAPVLGTDAGTLTPVFADADPDPDHQVYHNATTIKIGEMAAFADSPDGLGNANADIRLGWNLTTPLPSANGFTVVIIEQRINAGSAGGNSFYAGKSGQARFNTLERFGSEFQPTFMGDTGPNGPAMVTTPRVIVWTHAGTESSGELYIDGLPNGPYPHDIDAVDMVNMAFLGKFDSSSGNIRGKQSLYAIYEHGVDATEAADLYELCSTWITTGQAPTQPAEETSGKFHANTNDTSELVGISWQWRASPADSWTDLDPATAAPLSNAEYLNENGQDNDTLHIKSAITSDKGTVRAKGTVDYMAEPAYSNPVPLIVVGAG